MSLEGYLLFEGGGGPCRFTVFRACTKSFSTPPTKLVFGRFDRGSYVARGVGGESIGFLYMCCTFLRSMR